MCVQRCHVVFLVTMTAVQVHPLRGWRRRLLNLWHDDGVACGSEINLDTCRTAGRHFERGATAVRQCSFSPPMAALMGFLSKSRRTVLVWPRFEEDHVGVTTDKVSRRCGRMGARASDLFSGAARR